MYLRALLQFQFSTLLLYVLSKQGSCVEQDRAIDTKRIMTSIEDTSGSFYDVIAVARTRSLRVENDPTET